MNGSPPDQHHDYNIMDLPGLVNRQNLPIVFSLGFDYIGNMKNEDVIKILQELPKDQEVIIWSAKDKEIHPVIFMSAFHEYQNKPVIRIYTN